MKKTLFVILVTLTLLVSFPLSVLGDDNDGNIRIITVPEGETLTILDYKDDVKN